MAEASIGSEIAGHKLESVAGRGGMGVVYKATQTRLNRPVALKLIAADLAADPSFRERFQHESEIAAQIEHPHVIPLYEAGEEDGQLYITMRYVEGTDLRAMIEREGALPPEKAANVLAQVCGALDAAHARGLVHRDIKPANVLIAGTSEEPYAYLTDFGLTKQAATSSGMTKTGMFVGTLDYIAPEQLQGGPVDARADVYALGCLLYQMLTGLVPYPRDTEPAKMWAHMQEPPPPIREAAPQVPEAFDEVIGRAMAKDPEARYPSAGDLARAAKAAAVDRTIGDTAERSVATGQAAPATAEGGQAATAYAQQPGTQPGGTVPGGWAQGTQPGTAGGTSGGGYPASPGTYPGTAPGYGPGQPAAKSKLPMIALIGGTALAAIIAFVVVLALAGGDDGDGGNQAGEIVGEPIPIGKGPRDLTFGAGAVWTANLDDNSVTRVDAGTGRPQQIPVEGSFPFEIDFDNNAVYVTSPTEIHKIDPATNRVVGKVDDTGGNVSSVAAGEGYLWITHNEKDTVTRVSQETLEIEGGPIKVGDQPISVATGEGAIWVSNGGDNSITRIEPSGDVFGQPLKLEFSPGGIGVVDGTIYVGTGNGIAEIDPTSFTVGEPVPLRGASFYDVGEGSLWATFPTKGELLRIDLQTKKPIGDPIPVGKGAQGAGVGVRGVPDVWVINTRASNITRVKP